MPRTIRSAWERLHWPQVAVLAIFVAGTVASLVFAPQHLVEKIVELDWKAAAGFVVAVSAALAGIGGGSLFRPKGDRDSEPPRRAKARWEDDGYDDEPPTDPAGPNAINRAARPPGTSSIPPRRREGSAQHTAMLTVVALVGVLAVAALLASGCGSNAVQVHTSAIRIAAATYGGATEIAETVYTAELQACSDVACVDAAESRWAPVEVASAGVLVALNGWYTAVELAQLAGDTGALWRAAVRAIERVGAAWNRLRESALAVGVELPALPTEVLAAAAAIGGVS